MPARETSVSGKRQLTSPAKAEEATEYYIQKKSTMIATLKKVQNMAGSKNELWESAEDKLREFARIGYPMRVRRYVCYRMYKETGDETWVGVATRQN